jgi:hypothetical protein
MLSCSLCGKLFATPLHHSQHLKACDASITVQYENQKVVILKDPHGFRCYCEHDKCPRYFGNSSAIIQHARDTKKRWIGFTQVHSLVRLLSKLQLLGAL